MLKTISNEHLSVQISETGAELKHLKSLPDQKEWMWSADPEFWPRTAPILFPVVGKLQENQYTYLGKPYPMNQHGFARDRVFEPIEHSPEKIRFRLCSDYESLKFYPFRFELEIGYTLAKNWLWIDYVVSNKGEETMYFSIGGHPGFALPGWPDKGYSLVFEEPDILEPMLLEAGLLKGKSDLKIMLENLKLPITSQLFEQDALVLSGLRSSWIGIESEDFSRRIRVHFEGFPHLGLWSKPGAAFVCIEPWFGHADLQHFSGEISQKTGILHLEPGSVFHCRYAIEVNYL